jgi:hypothetical protein
MPYFGRVERYCFFLAHSRTGHSLVASLLSAHPDALVSDELGVLDLVDKGFNRSQIFALIWNQDFRRQKRERRKSGYSYAVEGSFQGVHKEPLVIGDAKGGAACLEIKDNPDLVERLRATMGVPIRAIIHLRNPFDTIATMSKRQQVSVDAAIERFKLINDARAFAISLLREEEMHTQRHEDLIAEPDRILGSLFEFLDLGQERTVIESCKKVLWQSPNRTRRAVDWSSAQVRVVEDMIISDPLLRSYLETETT